MCWSSLTPSCLEKPILGTIPRAFSCTFCRQTLTPSTPAPNAGLAEPEEQAPQRDGSSPHYHAAAAPNFSKCPKVAEKGK